MKKTIVVFLTLVLLLTQLTSMTYPTETDSSSISNDTVVSASARSPYEKIHVYTHQDDENDYSCIKNESELSTALHALKSYTASLASAKTLQTDQSDIRITVEFESGFSETEEYITFRDQLSKAKSIAEVREIRKKLNSFSKKYHAELIKSNAKLLSAMEYDTIDEVGYSPFVVMETMQDTLEISNLIALAGNNTVTNISIESTVNYIDMEVDEETNVRANTTTSTGYGSEITYTWDQMLECVGAKSVVDYSLYEGEGVIIGVLDSGICDLTNPNLLGKDITVIPNNGTVTDHATTVTSVIARIAPKATIIYDKRVASMTLENLLDHNCDIINVSQGGGSLTYTPSLDGIYDYQIFNHFIVVVKSAGNNGSSNHAVTSPGQGYNVITVGGVTGTNTGKVIYDTDSSYNENTDHVKPNVCGVYNYYIPYTYKGNIPSSCTSFAAPQVTACIALILEAYLLCDDVWLMPEEVFSLVMCGAVKTDCYGVYNVMESGFDQRVGAGVFNLRNCLASTTFVDGFLVDYATSGNEVYTKTVRLEAGESIQVALSLCVPALSNDDGSTANAIDFTDFDVYLYKMAENEIVAYSSLSDLTNNEFFRYNVTSTDRYRIVVKAQENQTSSTETHYVGVAYSIIN